MAVILLGLYIFELVTPGIAHYFGIYSAAFSKELVLTIFFISETILGLVPPDLFIVWAKQFASPYAVVTVLAILSYVAGLVAYYMGFRLVAIRQLSDYIHVKFEKQFTMLRSWGGLIIVIAALLPLPFSTMCLGAGMLKYSFRTLALLGMFRIARFFAYAAVLYQVV
jgi:membrane protein YqaA with SNARE-associated domain